MTLRDLAGELVWSYCGCGADHAWIEWRGYMVGPFPPALAQMITETVQSVAAGDGGGAVAGIALPQEGDPMLAMLIAAAEKIPCAAPCTMLTADQASAVNKIVAGVLSDAASK